MAKPKILFLEVAIPVANTRQPASCGTEPTGKILQSSHQIPDSRFQRFGNRLNRKETRVFQTAFNAAQKCAVNVSFGGKGFLRQFPLRADFPNSLAESFGNVVAQSHPLCSFAIAAGCRLYTTTPLDSSLAKRQNRACKMVSKA
jgi:hypothetical protein